MRKEKALLIFFRQQKRYKFLLKGWTSRHIKTVRLHNDGYDIIDEMIVWKAVENHLPILVKEVKEILDA
ncbi:MAG: hypothetical protein NUV74_10010 [Candidatus Brocadiaceae bacterium]|nr:hypothetical protein [Candidatus Brocadiaceae bacterium]